MSNLKLEFEYALFLYRGVLLHLPKQVRYVAYDCDGQIVASDKLLRLVDPEINEKFTAIVEDGFMFWSRYFVEDADNFKSSLERVLPLNILEVCTYLQNQERLEKLNGLRTSI